MSEKMIRYLQQAFSHLTSDKQYREIELSLNWAEKPGHYLISYDDVSYPSLLREIPSPPTLLFVVGNLECLATAKCAIVGSRHPTPIGYETALHFASTLAQLGITITSGLALGIDSAAHLGALEENGRTIAVLGCGLNTIYPSTNHQLAERIKEKGALISEYGPSASPTRYHFPARNRIISGLSRATLVVEAAAKSGSLITAQHALEQNREVMAIPGSIHNPLTKGCHKLIQQGAKLIGSLADVIEEVFQDYQDKATPRQLPNNPKLTDVETKVISAMGYDITPLAEIERRSGLTTEKLCLILLNLELRGYITAVQGGYCQNSCRNGQGEQ